METIDMIIDESTDWSGIVSAISLTDAPAIEAEAVALSKEEEVKLSAIDEDRRIFMGAVLIPEKKILRKREDGSYYNIRFPKETISRASQMFLEKGNQNNSTLEHEIALSGNTVTESWIIEDEVHDKSRKFGLNHPVGTWMVSMKISEEETWEKAKNGTVKGFSIEGLFSGKKAEEDVMMSLLKDIESEIDKTLKQL
tara:strand:+ start:1274 stop:1864 length:591 start_codon:yes stop_codon:yes gene_type:complete